MFYRTQLLIFIQI